MVVQMKMDQLNHPVAFAFHELVVVAVVLDVVLVHQLVLSLVGAQRYLAAP